MSDLTKEQMKTLTSIYELVCHLMHLEKENFLPQFCDSVYIIASDLLQHILSDGKHSIPKKKKTDFDRFILLTISFLVVYDTQGMQLICVIVSILCFVLRETPENAEIVEKILFGPDVSLVELLKNGTVTLK